MGEGVGGWVDKPKAGSPCNDAVFSIGDRDVHNPQDRLRRPLTVVWHTTNSDQCSPVAPQPCNLPMQFHWVASVPGYQ